MIELRNITRSWEDFSLTVNFTVADGEFLTLLGHSGSGKTTTLRILAGFEQATNGQIFIDGEDVTNLPAQKRGVGYVFQDYTLFPHLTVGQNVAYGLRVLGASRKAQQQRVDELLELVGLQGFADRTVPTLSGGEQQRVAVARALAPRPRVLLLDEPFSAIDTERRESLREHLLRVQRELELPTIFVTHSRTEALYLSDRIIILRNGKEEDQGPPEELYRAPNTEYAARFLGKANLLPGPDDHHLRMIRPENLRLSATPPGQAATVQQRNYYGAWWEYTVSPTDAGSGAFNPQGDPLRAISPDRYEPGERLFLCWDTADVVTVTKS